MHSTGADEFLNIADYFLDARIRAGDGDRTALIANDQTHSYAALQSQAGRWAEAFERMGLEREQRVLIALPDEFDFAAAVFGALKLGLIVVMANPMASSAQLGDLASRSRSRVLICRADQTVESDLRNQLKVIHPDACSETGTGLDTLVPGNGENWAVRSVATHRDESAIWLLSGGTTGRPKLVMQTHAAFVYTTEKYAHAVLGIQRSDITISVPRLHFGYATGSNLLFPLSVGATAILDDQRCTPERLCHLIAKHRATVLVNVPTMVAKILAYAEDHDIDLSSLRLSSSAGEALPRSLHEAWRSRFASDLLDGLGTAEMWHIFISNHPGDVRPGSLGRAIEGFDVRISDDEGREVPTGESGWLEVRGGARALGYWLDRPATEAAFRGDYYRTGDMVRRDAEGFIYYCGRGDDMLKVSGKWLAPAELESKLVEHPSVAEAVVVGAEDAKGLHKAFAFVVPGPQQHIDGASLRAHLLEQLEHYKIPRAFYRMAQLPRTHLGKADRGQLRQLVGSREFPLPQT